LHALRQPAQRLPLPDIATGKMIGTLPGHDAEAIGVAFSPDGQTCISGLS